MATHTPTVHKFFLSQGSPAGWYTVRCLRPYSMFLLIFCSGSAVAEKVKFLTSDLERIKDHFSSLLQMFMLGAVPVGETSVIKFSGCQSHLIAAHNSEHPDGFY